MFHCADHRQVSNQKGTPANVRFWHETDIQDLPCPGLSFGSSVNRVSSGIRHEIPHLRIAQQCQLPIH